jgi:hypothetical protein
VIITSEEDYDKILLLILNAAQFEVIISGLFWPNYKLVCAKKQHSSIVEH